MSKIVEMERSCAYLVDRAVRHRRAARYDEAMTLLSRAKEQFGLTEEIELEMARVYDEIGCDEEACRSYLRVVRLNGNYCKEALLQLALHAFQRSDIPRADSYFERYVSAKGLQDNNELAEQLEMQLCREMDRPRPLGPKGRASALMRRAAGYLQSGKTSAAMRSLTHALDLHPTARGYTMRACCYLLRGEVNHALEDAQRAHRMSPSYMQAICVLADAYGAAGRQKHARRMIYLAGMRARTPEDLLLAAMESAKSGEDSYTLLLSRRLLNREPFHTQGMMIRACALVNLGRNDEARRILGRLCRLLPEDSVCYSYFRRIRDGYVFHSRLDFGADVIREEGIERASQMLSLLYEDPADTASDPVKLKQALRNAAWAFRSSLVGPNATTIALILMSALPTDDAHEVLLDVLTEPAIQDSVKIAVLQALTAKEGFRPYDVDLGGRLSRLAAGGMSTSMTGVRANSEALQSACDMLSARFKDAPGELLPIYLRYLERYGEPPKKCTAECAAALVYIYHWRKVRQVIDVNTIALRCGARRRRCAVFVRRLLKVSQEMNMDQKYIMEDQS